MAVFGYITASFASFFIGRDKESDAEAAGEMSALRAEYRRIAQRIDARSAIEWQRQQELASVQPRRRLGEPDAVVLGGQRVARAAFPIWLSTISGACPVGYPSLDLLFILSGMMSLAAPAFLPIRLRAPDDEAA